MSVTNGNDTGPGSLRDQIDNTTANVILITPAVTTITLDSSIVIPRNLAIIGSNNQVITITDTGVFSGHVFVSDPAIEFTIRNIRFVGNALNTSDAGIASSTDLGSSLTVDNCSVTDWVTADINVSLFSGTNSNMYVTNTNFSNNQTGFLVISNINTGVSQVMEYSVENCQVLNNILYRGGFCWADGIQSNRSIISYRNLFFEGNTLDQSIPTASSFNLVYVEADSPNASSPSLIVDNVEMTNNVGILKGVGVYLGAARVALSISVSRIRITNNTATAKVGAGTDTLGLWLSGSSESSGVSTPRQINVDNVFIQNNTFDGRVGITLNPGASLTIPVTINVTNVSVMNNTSTNATLAPTPIMNIMGDNVTNNLSNIMIGYNTTTTIGGIRIAGTGTRILRNVSIVGNVGTSVGGLLIEAGATAPVLFNTLIADNWNDTARTIRSDVLGAVGSNSFNNLIADGTGMTGIVDAVNGNQVGTSLAPIDAVLGMPGNYGGDHDFTVVPLLEGSPAIDAGDNVYIFPGTTYDVRGSPLARVYNSIVDIGAFEWQPFIVPCYLADTPIKVKDKDGEVKVLKAKEVVAGKHQVYDMVSKKFIDVVNNARVQGVEVVYEIPPNHFGENVPAESLFITSGHLISLDGKPTKMRDVPGAIRRKIARTDVYSIVCKVWTPIDISGVGVYAWSKHKWDAHVKKSCIVWTENK